MRVAITYDWLNQFGGGERVLLELHRMFPEAPIFTTVHDPKRLPEALRGLDVRTSFLQRLPIVRRRHQMLLPLMPLAFEQFDFREFDLVLTTNSACAKGVITPAGTLNLCYCFTPCRYIWDLYHEYTQHLRSRALIAPIAHWLRTWDRLAADRVDHFVAISNEVADRINRHYRRSAEVIYPPVDLSRFTTAAPEDYYLVVSRLVRYKRVDLAIQAANRLNRRLLIVGDGPDRRRLETMGGPTVEFLGRRDDDELADLFARCRALLFPGREDFGITPVEAQAAGRPVIAFGRGGATETVRDGTTGVFFGEQTVSSVCEAILRAERINFDATACRRNVERFDSAHFRSRFRAMVERETEAAGRAPTVDRASYMRLV